MKTKFIAFGNQKGGCGKTTLNTMLANYIFNNVTESVVGIDADPQKSWSEIRSIYDSEAEENESTYEVLSLDSAAVLQFCQDTLDGNVEYVIIDLPGTLYQEGVVQSYMILDAVFIPMELNMLETRSSMQFHENMQELVVPKRVAAGYGATKMYGVLNKVKKNMKEFHAYEAEGPALMGFENLEFLENYIVDSATTFQRGVSSNEDYKHSRYPSLVKNFCKEVLSKI
jgi:cellulose biosynthesis protein BcsQ